MAPAAAQHDGELAFEVERVAAQGPLEHGAVADQAGRHTQEQRRIVGLLVLALLGVIGVVQTHRDDFRRNNRNKSLDAFERNWLLFIRRRTKDIALEAKQFAVHYFCVEDFVALLKSANRCHI